MPSKHRAQIFQVAESQCEGEEHAVLEMRLICPQINLPTYLPSLEMVSSPLSGKTFRYNYHQISQIYCQQAPAADLEMKSGATNSVFSI